MGGTPSRRPTAGASVAEPGRAGRSRPLVRQRVQSRGRHHDAPLVIADEVGERFQEVVGEAVPDIPVLRPGRVGAGPVESRGVRDEVEVPEVGHMLAAEHPLPGHGERR